MRVKEWETMCKGTVVGDGLLIYLDEIHPSIRNKYTKNIFVDTCIHDEIKYLLSNGVATRGHSCCGHGKAHAQAFVHPEYTEKAIELGYEVVKVNASNWEKGREESCILLKTGTQGKPVIYKGFIHE
jgi:hypothetical protein